MPTIELGGKEYSGEKLWRNEEVLRTMYVEKRLPATEIAETLGCAVQTIYNQLEKHGIETRTMKESRRLVERRRPVPLRTHDDGYVYWMDNTDSEAERVYTHRLLAVAEYGFEAVQGNIVHHGKESGTLPACELPWANWGENIEVMGLGEHTTHHARVFTDAEEGVILERYESEDMTKLALSKELGVDDSTVGFILERARQRRSEEVETEASNQ